MQIPAWLAALTNANKFANNPANGFRPTLGDALQGIGSDMLRHYRGLPNPAAGMQRADAVAPAAPFPPPQALPLAQILGAQRPPQLGASANWGSLQPIMNPQLPFMSPPQR